MRVFTGSGGALYLLSDPVADGWRPRTLLATIGRWELTVREEVAVGEATGADGERPVGVRRHGISASLECTEFRSGLPLRADDEVELDLDAMAPGIVWTAELPPSLAAHQRQEPLVIDDLKEVSSA